MTEHTENQGAHRRSLNVFFAAVIGVAFVGFFVGIRPMPRPEPESAAGAAALPTDGEVRPPQNYRDVRLRRVGRNHDVTSDLGLLRATLPGPQDDVDASPELRAQAVAARAERRAYDGAPPMIPHEVDEQRPFDCLACHAEGIELEGHVAPRLSHPPFSNCTQCHARAQRPGFDPPDWPNSFVGLESAGKGPRAWTGAPPQIPHAVWMRQECASCHGLTGRPGLRTTHPDRVSCRQCHVSTQIGRDEGTPW